MSLLYSTIAIEEAFRAHIPNDIFVSFDNVEFKPDSVNEWIRLTIVDGDSNQASLGGTDTNLFRHYGVVVVNVFTQPNSGARRSLEILDIVSQFFHNVLIQETTFLSPGVRHIGVVGGWYQKNMLCNFYRNENF